MSDVTPEQAANTIRHYINSWAHDGGCMIFLPSGKCTCEPADKTIPLAALKVLEDAATALRDLVDDMGLDDIDPRLRYVTAQITRSVLADAAPRSVSATPEHREKVSRTFDSELDARIHAQSLWDRRRKALVMTTLDWNQANPDRKVRTANRYVVIEEVR